jgi:hypothetical protein
MFSIKDYPEEFSTNHSKNWGKFKKKMKKIAHTKLRRGAEKYQYSGREVAW